MWFYECFVFRLLLSYHVWYSVSIVDIIPGGIVDPTKITRVPFDLFYKDGVWNLFHISNIKKCLFEMYISFKFINATRKTNMATSWNTKVEVDHKNP